MSDTAELADRADKAEAALAEALAEIAKGEGCFSREQLEHASNTLNRLRLSWPRPWRRRDPVAW